MEAIAVMEAQLRLKCRLTPTKGMVPRDAAI